MMASPRIEQRIGRDGSLFLEYQRVGHRTILKTCLFRNPLQVLPPTELDGGSCAYTQILNPCGGVVGGDHFEVKVCLGQAAHCLISTPSATRIYRSSGETSQQQITLKVGPDAILEWFPDPVIPFAESRFRQRLHAHLHDGAILFLWDAFCSGRVARGERWAFIQFANELCVAMPDGKKVLERYALNPKAMNLTAPGLGEKWDYFASFFIISARSLEWSALIKSLKPILNSQPRAFLGGVSELSIPGLAVRLVAKTAVGLAALQASLWDSARRLILGAPAPNLRKY